MPPLATDSGLIALWNFQNNILDSGPSGYHLSKSGIANIGFKNDIPTPPLGAFCLSGFNPNPIGLFADTLTGVFNKTITPNWTIEFQVFPTGVTGGDCVIFQEASGINQSNPHSNFWRIDHIGSPASIQFGLNASGMSIGGPDNTRIPRKAWSHIAYTFNSSGNIMSKYLNGTLSGVSTGVFYRPDMTTKIIIGAQSTFNGILISNSNVLLKNFAIYNYIKTNFDVVNNVNITIDGVPNNSYAARLYDKELNIVSNNDSHSYDANTKVYTIPLSGIFNRQVDLDMLVLKNNWVTARNNDISGLLTGYNFNLV